MGFIVLVDNDVIVTDTTNYRELSGYIAPCNQHHWFTNYGIFMPASYESIQIMQWLIHGDECVVLPPNAHLAGVLFTHRHYTVIDIVSGFIDGNGSVLPTLKSTFVTRPIFIGDNNRDVITTDKTTRNAVRMVLETTDKVKCLNNIEKLKNLHPDIMQKFKTTYQLSEIMGWCEKNKDKIKRVQLNKRGCV